MSYNKFIKYQKSNSCYFFNKQYIGRRFGKEGPLQSLIKLEQDIGNRLANPGTDTVFSALPFLRFLPIPISLAFIKPKAYISKFWILWRHYRYDKSVSFQSIYKYHCTCRIDYFKIEVFLLFVIKVVFICRLLTLET